MEDVTNFLILILIQKFESFYIFFLNIRIENSGRAQVNFKLKIKKNS